jgi:hypothetical protein
MTLSRAGKMDPGGDGEECGTQNLWILQGFYKFNVIT